MLVSMGATEDDAWRSFAAAQSAVHVGGQSIRNGSAPRPLTKARKRRAGP
jgi:hypothetical protein